MENTSSTEVQLENFRLVDISHQLGIGVAQAEAADEVRISGEVCAAQVLQQRAALAEARLQPPPACIVLAVRPHVLRQLRDALRQQRDCVAV